VPGCLYRARLLGGGLDGIDRKRLLPVLLARVQPIFFPAENISRGKFLAWQDVIIFNYWLHEWQIIT
jgi:hypothetical protein